MCHIDDRHLIGIRKQTDCSSRATPGGETIMSDNLLKAIEVLSESDKSWEDAAQQAVARAAKTLHGIKSIYIKNFEAKVDNNKIVKYRINANVTFLLD
jgi:flavin-binding protein dodecin